MKTELIDENGIKVWQVWRVPKHFSAWNHRERRWPHPDKMNWKNSPLWKGPFRKTKFSSTKCRSNNLKFLQLNLEEMRQIVSKYQRFSSVQNLIGSVDILMFALWGEFLQFNLSAWGHLLFLWFLAILSIFGPFCDIFAKPTCSSASKHKLTTRRSP